MFPRKPIKQNKLVRLLLKVLKIYAYERETLNVVNPDYKNQYGNFVKFNDKSFNFTQGYLDLSRKLKKLDIFFRYAPNNNLWKSNKGWKRIIPDINKEILISICLLSLKGSINHFLNKNNFDITVHLVSDNSNEIFDKNLLKLLKDDNFNVKLHNSKISGNRGSYLECCDQAEKAEDLIFFVEDDYLFEKNSLDEMLITYSRISSILNNDVILCPSDYSFYYDSFYKTSLFVGKEFRWRLVGETLLTFMISKKIFNNYKNLIRLVGEKENDPFEKPLHQVYKEEVCLAPVNSLAYHISRSVPAISEQWQVTWNEYYDKYTSFISNQQ